MSIPCSSSHRQTPHRVHRTHLLQLQSPRSDLIARAHLQSRFPDASGRTAPSLRCCRREGARRRRTRASPRRPAQTRPQTAQRMLSSTVARRPATRGARRPKDRGSLNSVRSTLTSKEGPVTGRSARLDRGKMLGRLRRRRCSGRPEPCAERPSSDSQLSPSFSSCRSPRRAGRSCPYPHAHC